MLDSPDISELDWTQSGIDEVWSHVANEFLPNVGHYCDRLIDGADFLVQTGEPIGNNVLGHCLSQLTAIPTIRKAQQVTAQRYLTMSSIATFFSSVTASMLQVSLGQGSNEAVNVLWFSSLVLSIASAIYSLLGATWHQSKV